MYELRDWLASHVKKTKDESQKAFQTFAISQIKLFESDPKQLNLTRPADPPDGPPIGDGDSE